MRRRSNPLRWKVLHVVGWTIDKVYKVLFGWADVRALKKRERVLRKDVAEAWSHLLKEKGGRFTDEGKPQSSAFDYATAVVAFPDVMIRVIRGRGELQVQFASPRNPESWDELSLMVRRAQMSLGVSVSDPLSDLSLWADTVERFWPYLISEAA